MLSKPFADAILEDEKLITSAPHVQTEQDLAEGYDYLAGMIRQALSSAWSFDKDFPFFIRSATPYTKVGLDNPDTLYWSARIRDDALEALIGQRLRNLEVPDKIGRRTLQAQRIRLRQVAPQ